MQVLGTKESQLTQQKTKKSANYIALLPQLDKFPAFVGVVESLIAFCRII